MATTTIHQGQDLVLTVTVYEDAALTTPKDLTGATIIYRIGDKADHYRALNITATPTANGSVTSITDAAGGVMTVTLDKLDMEIPATTYDHQIFITDAAGNLDVVYDDRLEVKSTIP